MLKPAFGEPVRGGYPDIGIVGLPGPERTNLGSEPKFPPPPLHHLFGLTPTVYGKSGSVFTMPASPWLQSGAGVFLAGVSALVADAPLGSAIIYELGRGGFGTTSQLSMSFQRPVTVESKELTARASAVDVGSAVGLSEAIVEDAHGRLIALMTSRYFLTSFDPPPPAPEVWVPEQPTYDTPSPWARPLPKDPEPRWDLGGLDYFNAVLSGEVPPAPCAQLLGIEITDVAEGTLSAQTSASEWFCSPSQTVYGGVLAFLADFAMTTAATTTIPAGSTAATLDLTLHFLRPVLPTGETLTMTGKVIHRGRSLIVANAEVRNAAGKPVVVGNGSLRVLPNRVWSELNLADTPMAPEEG